MKKARFPPTPTEHTSVRKESGYVSQEKTDAAIVDPATVTSQKSPAKRLRSQIARRVADPTGRMIPQRRVPRQYQMEPGIAGKSGTDLGVAGFAVCHRRVFRGLGGLRGSRTGACRPDLYGVSERAEPPRRSLRLCFTAAFAGLDAAGRGTALADRKMGADRF